MSEPHETLPWPPKKEDLEKLYLVEGLSAAKIAAVYGLSGRYKTPKVEESTILYHLKRNGIPRRDPAELARKVTAAMEDEWVEQYAAGSSLKQIAGDAVDPVTVWNHLRARGVVLRGKIEAQIRAVTKYERRPFDGNRIEKAYLMGLRYGDLHAVKHGRAIRVRVSTTHPAMADLFDSAFAHYGHVHRYPREAKLVGHEWTLECDLDASFEFLLEKVAISVINSWPELEFVAFLAGLFDAEGSFHLHRKAKWYDPEASISNSDSSLLDAVAGRLTQLHFHAALRWRKQQNDRKGISGQSLMGRVEISRFLEAQRFANLVPIRHSEKLKRKELLLRVENGSSVEERLAIANKWKELSKQIDEEVQQFVQLAKQQLVTSEQFPCLSSSEG